MSTLEHNNCTTDGFSARLNEELDRVRVAPKARAKLLAELTGMSIPAARKWLVNNSMPRGDHLPLICNKFNLDIAYITYGINNSRALSNEVESYNDVNIILQSMIIIRVYTVAKKHGLDIHNPSNVSEDNLERAYNVLMKLAAKNPTHELDEDIILSLIK